VTAPRRRFRLSLRAAATVFVCGAAALAVGRSATAQSAKSQTNDPACPAGVLSFVALEPASATGARTYAVAFETFAAAAGRLSGTVSLYSGAQRYDVPFKGVIAVPALASEVGKAVPITIRFNRDVAVEAAYLSAIDGPNAGPCGLGNIYMSKPGSGQNDLFPLNRDLRERAQNVQPIDAPPPASDPRPCDKPDVPASTTFAATPRYPDLAGQRGDSGIAEITVALAADGRVLAAWLYKSSGWPLLDAAGLAAASVSRFSAGTFRCKPVFGIYKFVTDFEHS
jgi:TonB family protein